MTERPHCLNAATCAAKNPGKHCQSCASKEINARPGFVDRKRAAYQEWLAKPENRARFHEALKRAAHKQTPEARASRHRAGKIHGPRNFHAAQTPEAREKARQAIRATKLAHIPPEYWDDYRTMIKSGIRKVDATAVINARIEAKDPAAIARRQIAEFDRKQRERAAREKAQAY